ncbi:MAG: DNA-binding protein [Candidatus Micrarchaeaceae archaeon]
MSEESESNDEEIRRIIANRIKEQKEEEYRKKIARAHMSPEAYERLMNVKVANYELYKKLLELIVNLAESKRIGIINDAALKELLEKLTYKREPTIEFKHK